MKSRLLVEKEKVQFSKISPINCSSIIESKYVNFDCLKQRYGQEFYIVSLFSEDKTPNWNMYRTYQFLQYLIFEDYVYFPVYVVNQETSIIQNIFLFVFNYHSTTSFQDIVRGQMVSNCFEDDMKSLFEKYKITTYVYREDEICYLRDHSETHLFPDGNISTMITVYLRGMGFQTDGLGIFVNDVPSKRTKEIRAIRKEICLSKDLMIEDFYN